MGADWYFTEIIFGYKIKVPTTETYRKFMKKLKELEENIPPPFKIMGILANFHNRMQLEYEMCEMDSEVDIVLGFIPPNNLDELGKISNDLKKFTLDNSIFKGIEISESPQFFCGIDWS